MNEERIGLIQQRADWQSLSNERDSQVYQVWDNVRQIENDTNLKWNNTMKVLLPFRSKQPQPKSYNAPPPELLRNTHTESKCSTYTGDNTKTNTHTHTHTRKK
eukprot:GHVR01055501.1.p1 GENE.GHVR01055501.1~~GHVR01055501.1.p1  ORF type:complete len:103 (+),score=43.58 GHVR01055501.1:186-494(+)